MNPTFLKPSGHARTIETSSMGNTGISNNGNPYTQIDPVQQLRSFMERSSGGLGNKGAGSGIRWDTLGSNLYEDEGFRALKGDQDVEEAINREFLVKYAAVAASFADSLVQRRGGFYAEFRAVLEHFQLSKTTGAICNIREAFVKTVNGHPEFIVHIASAGIPPITQILIDMAKQSPEGIPTPLEYRKATQMASTMVLTMEFISWLSKSREGREKALYLTPEIKKTVGDLEKFKDIFTHACTTIGVSNPYAGLVFEVNTVTRTDSSMIVEAERALKGMTDFGGTAFDSTPQEDVRALYEQVYRTAELAKENHVPHHQNTDTGLHSVEWETKPVDYTRITESNKEKFDYRKLFKWLKDDWYFIPESDWKKIKHVFKRHEDQPEQEDSVLYGTFRIVKINFDTNDGWFSTIIRAEGIDMASAFMDPKLLLPALEISENGYNTQVAQVPVEKVLGNDETMSIPTGVVEKLEGIPLITVKDEITAPTSKAVMAALSSTNKSLTSKVKGVNAVSFKTRIWEFFNCDSEADKNLLIKSLPFLFKDLEDNTLSFFMRIKKVVNFFDSGVMDDEIGKYIDNRLTLMVNDWLINSLGYHNSPDHHGYLAVESIFEDYSDLDNVFKESDEEAFRCFNGEGNPSNYLTEQMKLFVSQSPLNKINKSDSVVDKVQKKLRLVVDRPIYFVSVNKRLPPSKMEEDDGGVIVIRRSKFPEFFHMIDEGFLPTMGKGKEPKVIDKIFHFDEDDTMWLFSYSSLDINMASMRRVTTRKSLLLLDLV